jgi:hypothetical protein
VKAEVETMIEVVQDIVISTPPSDVFAFLCDPLHATRLVSGLEIDEVIERPGGLHLVRTHAMSRRGSIIHSESELVERVPETRVVDIQRTEPFFRGRCETLVTRTLTAVPEGTLLTTKSRFDVSPHLLGLYLSLFQRDKFMLSVHRMNERIQAALTQPEQGI